MSPASPPSVSLVLGSGGARGLAQIGVIEWLTENGYAIRSIAGSSMGALVGGIHASGKLATYTEWVRALERIEVLRLLDPAFGSAGLFKGERIMEVLRRLIGEVDIEALPVSFTAVAMDLDSGKEVWLRKGRLFDAVRASIAIPMLFTPVPCEGRLLVDGGLVNPVPIAPTLNDTTDLIVAVNVGAKAVGAKAVGAKAVGAEAVGAKAEARGGVGRQPGDALPGMLDVALRSMEAMENTIARLKLAAYSPDVIVDIPRDACHIHEFWRAEEMIALGRERAALAFARRQAASDPAG